MFIRPLALALGVCLIVLCPGLSSTNSYAGNPDFSQNQPTELWKWPVPYQSVQERMVRTEVILDFSFCTDAYVSGLPGLMASPHGSEDAVTISFNGSTMDGDQWSPPDNCNENLDLKESNYSLHYFTVDQSGLYSFTGQFEDWSGRMALYQGSFNPNQPFNNCYDFSQRDLGSGDAQISSVNLAECSTYALVITGDSLPEFGNYDVSYSGPGLAIAPETGKCLSQNSGLYGETRWYDQEEAGMLLYTGNSFNPVSEELIDPMIDGSYTYYVAFFTEGEESQRYIASVDAGDCSVRITDPCSCRNNASNSVNGQFNEVIEVEAPSGQTWTLLNNAGLYEPISPNSLQSDILIQAGTVLTESPMTGGISLYSLEGVHTDALGYSVDVTNGSTVLSQSNTCHYPNPMIINLPNQTCTQSPEFTLQGTADQPGSGSFTIDGVATDLFDPAALGVGRVEVVYTFDADGNPGPGETEPGCIQSVRQQVDITSDPLTACLKNINVSLGTNCSAQITTNMLLTNDPCMVSGSFTLQVMTLDSVLVPNNVITEVGTYIGEVISNSSGNRCWGYIHAEDKIAPTIFCPDNVIIDCQASIDPANTGMPTADDNCSDTRFEYSDSLALDNCSTGDIFRTWIVFDAFDNSDTCVQIISLIDNQPVIIDWPDDLTLDCPQDQMSLHPDSLPARFGKPLYSSNCRDLADNYRDQIYDICSPASFKIHREWKIRDWCDPDTLWEHTQIIKVLDTVPPGITCPDDLTLQVQHNECELSLTNYRPVVSDVCDPDPSFSIRVFDEFGLIADPDRLTPGTYEVEFTASDACGNESQCRTKVEVQDLIAPVPVCDQNTNLTLTNDGWADLCYTVIDDRSMDNCRIAERLIKREGEPDSLYRECITFRCEDIGLNKIHLRIEDIYGNTNSCWANVYVEDKKDPGIICPDDVTVNCDADLSDPLNTGGFPVVLDNCDSLQATFTDEKGHSSCATGIVTRTWRVEKILVGPDGLPGTSDDVIKFAECEQIITVVDTTEVDIQWPTDLTILCTGNAISLAPGDLHVYNRQDTIYDRPIVTGEDCEHLGISFDDQVFQLCGPESYKVRRVWHIVDWCSDLDTSYVQTLWVKDEDPPILDVEDVVVDITTNVPACEAFVELIADASDACTQVFVQNDSRFTNLSGRDASGIYPKGTTEVTFIASDACGNRTTKTVTVTVRDAKAPVAICGAGFSAALKATGQVTVCAEMFNRGSYDNCTFQENLVYSIQQLDAQGNPVDAPQECIVFTCEDYNESALQQIRMIVTDADGNEGHCGTFVQLQDHITACGNNNNNPTFAHVHGVVTNPAGIPVDQMNVYINQVMMAEEQTGSYLIDSLATGREYELDLERVGPIHEGVTTLDMVMVRRHILRLQNLEAPYGMIAADVNGDGGISTRDLVEMRRAILRISNSFSGGYNWMFIPQAYQFPDSQDPWLEPFPTGGLIDLQGDIDHVDFTALKMGDVNGTAMARQSTPEEEMVLAYGSKSFENGQEISNSFVVQAPEGGLTGLQFCLPLPKHYLDNPVLESQWLNEQDYRLLERATDYLLMISWVPQEVMYGEIELFQLKALSKAKGDWNQILALNAGCLAPELYDGYTNRMELKLVEQASADRGYTLFQNVPNPFTNDTKISFKIPEDDRVKLEVFDVSGRRIWSFEDYYRGGQHVVEIEAQIINHPGIYIYQLTSGEFQNSKRMIMIE